MSLESEVLEMEVVFTAKGIRREDGMTSADIEKEMAAKEENNGAE